MNSYQRRIYKKNIEEFQHEYLLSENDLNRFFVIFHIHYGHLVLRFMNEIDFNIKQKEIDNRILTMMRNCRHGDCRNIIG